MMAREAARQEKHHFSSSHLPYQLILLFYFGKISPEKKVSRSSCQTYLKQKWKTKVFLWKWHIRLQRNTFYKLSQAFVSFETRDNL